MNYLFYTVQGKKRRNLSNFDGKGAVYRRGNFP